MWWLTLAIAMISCLLRMAAWGVQGLLKATAAWARQGTENAEHLVRSIFNSMDDFSEGGARRMMRH